MKTCAMLFMIVFFCISDEESVQGFPLDAAVGGGPEPVTITESDSVSFVDEMVQF